MLKMLPKFKRLVSSGGCLLWVIEGMSGGKSKV